MFDSVDKWDAATAGDQKVQAEKAPNYFSFIRTVQTFIGITFT